MSFLGMLFRRFSVQCAPKARGCDDSTKKITELAETARRLEDETARLRRAKEELSRSNENLQAFFDSLDDCVLVLSNEGKIITMNPATETKLGFARHDLECIEIARIARFPAASTAEMILEQARLSRFVRCRITLRTRENGNVTADASVVYSRWGGNRAFFVIARDAGASAKTEECLFDSERKLNWLAQSLPVVFWFASPGMKSIIFINPAFEKIYETPAQEFLRAGKNLADFIHPQDRQRVLGALSQAWPEPLEQEYRIITGTGNVKWIRTIISPILNSGNMVTMLSGISEDITARRTFDESMRENERKYSALVENAREGVCISVDGKIAFVNQAGAEMVGCGGENMIGRQYLGCIAPESQPVAAAFLESLADKPALAELSLLHKDGSRVLVEVSASRIPYMGGSATMCVARDITDRKRLEDELVKARDCAEAAGKAKTEFIANMSHEIRTPLNAITGMADLLLESGQTAEQKEFTSAIAEAAQHLLEITNDILDFSEIESGGRKLRKTCFCPREVVTAACRMFSPRAAAKGLRFECSASGALAEEMCGDAGIVRQILVNLVANAIKFTDAGAVRVFAASTSPVVSEAGLYLEVSDTGIGMSEEDVSKSFGRFSQADGSYTRVYGGMGLGLSITKSLVDMAGGKLWVESKKDVGSTFHILLPYSPVEVPGVTDAPPAPPCPGSCGKGRVLVVEDNKINLSLTKTMLTKAGYIVDDAVNGLIGVELARQNDYDVILMDIHMPVMDGSRAAVEIRRREREGGRPRTPIIALTADATTHAMEYCRKNGMDDYITKPVRSQTLLAIVRKWSRVKAGSGDKEG
ncbi:MAG: PAS domain S-box protein [Elusimicrobiales bacterium]